MDVLTGQRPARRPVWLMRQAGRYLPEYRALRARAGDFIAFCLNPELAAEATLQPLARFDLDAAIIFADILLIPHAIGAGVRFIEGEGPRLEPVSSLGAIERLAWSSAAERLSAVYETIAKVRAAAPRETAVIGFAGAPWTVASYMIGGGGGEAGRQAARVWAWREADACAALLDRLVDATADYLAAQAAAGANVLKIFESWAEGLPPPLFERLVITPTAAIIAQLRAKGVRTPIIGFPRGAAAMLARYAAETGVDAVALDIAAAHAHALAALPSILPTQGALDPAVLLAGGDALQRETDRQIALFADRPHIFNLGHGVWPETPPQHVAAFVQRLRDAP